jgi:hypothetical protein
MSVTGLSLRLIPLSFAPERVAFSEPAYTNHAPRRVLSDSRLCRQREAAQEDGVEIHVATIYLAALSDLNGDSLTHKTRDSQTRCHNPSRTPCECEERASGTARSYARAVFAFILPSYT